MHKHPDAWNSLMVKIRGVLSDYLRLQIRAGAHAVQIFDSWIGALSPDDYRNFVRPHSRFVIESARSLGVPVIHFGTGQSGFLEDFATAGGDVIGVDWRIDISEASKRIGNRALQGNLDPALLLCPLQDLKDGILKILAATGKNRGFIFNIGHGIFPQTDPKQVNAAINLVHSYHV